MTILEEQVQLLREENTTLRQRAEAAEKERDELRERIRKLREHTEVRLTQLREGIIPEDLQYAGVTFVKKMLVKLAEDLLAIESLS